MENKEKLILLLIRVLGYDLLIVELIHNHQYSRALHILNESILIYKYVYLNLNRMTKDSFVNELKLVIPSKIDELQKIMNQIKSHILTLH